MALIEKRLPFKSHVVNIVKGEQYKPWFLEINPRGEVPVLKDGVKIIPDSARIIDYLEDNFSNGLYFDNFVYGRKDTILAKFRCINEGNTAKICLVIFLIPILSILYTCQ